MISDSVRPSVCLSVTLVVSVKKFEETFSLPVGDVVLLFIYTRRNSDDAIALNTGVV